jgi:hypothetical protein
MTAMRFSASWRSGSGSAGDNANSEATTNCMTGNDRPADGGHAARPAVVGTMAGRRRLRVARDSALLLAAAVACAAATATGASAAPVRAAGHETRAEHAELAAGQTGTRSAVPWSKVGPGWALVEYTTGKYQKARPVTLYLVDPKGGKYRLYLWRATSQPWQLISWSGDKTRALFAPSSGRKMDQLNLETGAMTAFRLPASVSSVLGYTSPDGDSILVTKDGIARYSLAGKFQAQLIKGSQFYVAISAVNGQTDVTNAPAGVDVVRNTGGVIRRLHVPGVSRKSGGCTPVRWWSAATVLARCGLYSPKEGEQLWLVPVSGAAPSALTAERTGNGIDLGDFDAWRFSSGLYVQAQGACGSQFIGKQAANGTVTRVNVPGSLGTDIVTATYASRMFVRTVSGCFPSSAALWFNPATRAVTKVLPAPKDGLGVVYVVAYNRNGEEPSGLE